MANNQAKLMTNPALDNCLNLLAVPPYGGSQFYGSAEELKESFEAFLEEWNTLLAHPFRWSYDGKGLHEKAVNRFTKMLKQAANKLEISTLTKQLRLMTNLFDHYLA